MEGEYSDLSFEERLNALVSLIGVANEGNTIRVVLEKRLEAANALKRQMWAQPGSLLEAGFVMHSFSANIEQNAKRFYTLSLSNSVFFLCYCF
jgi:hypothetical protein